MRGGGERGDVAADLCQESCCDLDADSWHGRQDPGKRVGIEDLLHVLGDLFALVPQLQDLGRESGQHLRRGGGARDDDGLRGEAAGDLVGEAGVDAGGVLGQFLVDPCPAHLPQPLGPAGLDQQMQDRVVGDVVAQRLLQARVDLDQQPAQPVHRGGDLRSEVVVVAQQHRQVRLRLARDVELPQRVRDGQGSVRDDERIPCVGLRVPRVQVRQPAHRQPGQVRDIDAHRLRHGHRKRPDRVELVHHDQHPAPRSHLREDATQGRLGVRDLTIDEPRAVRVQGAGVMSCLADIEADDDVVVHGDLLGQITWPAWHQHSAATLRRDQQVRRPCPYQRSTDTTRTGDNTPRIINDRGSKSCRSQQPGAATRRPRTR